MASPMLTAMTIANKASHKVTGSVAAISSLTGAPVADGVAEVAVRQVAEELQVLHPHRLVEPQVGTDRLEGRRVGLLAGQGERGIPGECAHAEEDDEGRQEQRQQRLTEPRAGSAPEPCQPSFLTNAALPSRTTPSA